MFKYLDEFWEEELSVQGLGGENNLSEQFIFQKRSKHAFQFYTYSSFKIKIFFFQTIRCYQLFPTGVQCSNT